MPISHASIIHKPLDYTQPVNLDLMGKVLQYKQGQYDAGVNKVQQGIDSVAQMDMVKGVDKDYLNSKLNNLVETVNSIGGADFSDANVSNQIAGLSGQIYGDKHVVNAIANTKKFRYVQNYYQTLKEKHPKEWNPANEWFDMNRFSSWLGDGQVGTSPENNAGQVNPFVDYEKDWQNMFNKMKANATTTLTDKGLMYVIGTKTYMNQEQIWDAASKLLTPAQRGQIGIEGRYTYQGVPTENLIQAVNADLYKKVQTSKGQLEDYKTKLLGSTDIKDQEDYKNLIARKQQEIDGLMAPTQRNAEQIKEKLYLNEKLSGLASRYSFSQVSAKIQANTGAMFNVKHNLDVAKFQYQQGKDAIDQDIDVAKNGLMWHIDDLGHKTAIPDYSHPKWWGKLGVNATGTNGVPGANGSFNAPGLGNSLTGQQVTTTRENLDIQKKTLTDDNKQLFNQFVQDFGWKKGLSDLEINSLSSTGHLTAQATPEMQKVAQDFMKSWDAMANGQKINFDKIDPTFKEFAGRYQENIKHIEAIDDYYKKVDSQVKKSFGLNAEDDAKYTRYSQLQQQITDLDKKYPYVGNVSGGGNPYTLGSGAGYRSNATQYEAEKQAILNQMHHEGMDNILDVNDRLKAYNNGKDKMTNDLLSSGSVVYNYPTLVQGDDKAKTVAKVIAGNAGTMQVYDEAGNPLEKKTLNPDWIEPLNKSYAMLKGPNGTVKQPTMKFKYKTGAGTGEEKYDTYVVQLSPEQASAYGFGTMVKDFSGYEMGLHLNGQVKGIKTVSGDNYDLTYDIVKANPRNQNDTRVFVRVIKDGSPIILFNNTPLQSYQQAMQYMEGATKLKSYGEAMNYLTLLSQGKYTIPSK